MPIIFRTDGAWGAGLGVNLSPAQVDGNFWDLQGRLTYIEDNPVEPIEPISITIAGSQFSMGLSNGETLGPVTMTMPVPMWRGLWLPSTLYHEMDFFTGTDGGFGVVMVAHTSATTFDWAATVGGVRVYQEIVGSNGGTDALGDLTNVSVSSEADGDLLVYQAVSGFWVNQTKDYVATILPAFGGDSGSGGTQGMVPAPAAGDAAAGKVLGAGGGWVVPAGGGGGGSTSLAGLSDVAISSPANLSLLQFKSSDGKWHNETLSSLGAGTVGLVATGAGLTGGPITTSGTISLASVAAYNLLANVTGSTAAPAATTLTLYLDAVLGSARGSIMRRDATAWSVLTPGSSGTYLKSGGTGADVSWDTPAGAGTVTNIATGTGLTGGPITATGTIGFASVVNNTLLANISGGTAAPTPTTASLFIDAALGATQGQILYRGATAWTVLAPGASGTVLTAGGTGANPSWVAGAGTGTVTNVATGSGLAGGPITTTGTISLATIGDQTVLANISGSTAVPSGSSLTAVIDSAFGSTRGNVLYRGASGWAALGPGTAGQVLTTGGSGADPSWAAGGGASLPSGTAGDQLVYVSGAWTAQRPRWIASCFVPGIMTASQLLLLQRLSKAVTFPANFGTYLGHTSQARGTVNATASTAIDVHKATSASPSSFSSVGTITIGSAAMVATFTSVGGAAVTFAQGDTLALVGPATPDATFANFAATLVGYET